MHQGLVQCWLQLALLPQIWGLSSQAAAILASIAAAEVGPGAREVSCHVAALRHLVQPAHLAALLSLVGASASLDQPRQVPAVAAARFVSTSCGQMSQLCLSSCALSTWQPRCPSQGAFASLDQPRQACFAHCEAQSWQRLAARFAVPHKPLLLGVQCTLTRSLSLQPLLLFSLANARLAAACRQEEEEAAALRLLACLLGPGDPVILCKLVQAGCIPACLAMPALRQPLIDAAAQPQGELVCALAALLCMSVQAGPSVLHTGLPGAACHAAVAYQRCCQATM